MKRVWSVLLSLVLCLGMFPPMALAAAVEDNPELDVSSKGRIFLSEDSYGVKLYAQVYKDNFNVSLGEDSWTEYTGQMTITGNNNSVGYASIEVRRGEHDIVLSSMTLNATVREKTNGYPGLNIAGTGAKVNLTLEGNNVIRGSGMLSNQESSQPGILVGTGSSLTIGGRGTLRAVGGNTLRTTTGGADDGISVIGSLTIQDGVTVTAVGGNEGVTTGASQGDGILIGTGASLVVDNSHLVLNGKRPLQVGSGALTLRGPSSTLKASMPYAWEASIPCNLEPGSPEYYGVLNGNTMVNTGSATLDFKSSCSFAFSNQKYSLTVQEGGSGSSGGGTYIPGTPVPVSAGTKDGYAFHEWQRVSGSGSFADPLQAQTTFTTDMGDAVICPVFWPLHTLTVTGGTASKTRGVTGETVTLRVGEIPEGQAFARWEIVSGAGKLSDPRSPNSSFTFGGGDAQIRAVLVKGTVLGDFVVATEETGGYSYESGVLTISGNGTYTVRMRIPGNTTGNRIFLDGGSPKVILDGVQIHNSSESAIQLAFGSKTTNATLILSGENKLFTGGTGKAAIAVWTQNPQYYKANLTITSLAGDGSTEGRLEATGSNGIGTSGNMYSGAITINGGTIVATGNGAQRNCGFGIGRDGDYSGAVTINGGDVTAIGTGNEKRAFGKNPVLNNDPSIQVNGAFAHQVNDGSDQKVRVYYDSQGGSSVKSVAVTPREGEVLPGSTLQFTAQVEGGGNATKSVTWSVAGGAAGTSIDADGLLTVAQDETAQMLTVKATNDYSGISADAEVTVTKKPPEVFQWPTAGEITYGQALSEAALTGGTANTPGSFAWTDGTRKPPVGTGSFEVTFQPEDPTIPAVTGQVSVTVQPAAPVLTWDRAEQTVSYTGRPAVVTPPNVALVNGETYQGDIDYSYTVGDSGNYTPGLPVDVGEYWVKASVPALGNYTAAQSGEMRLIIEKDASPAAPASGEGYELDYIRETITVKPGYEVRTAADGETVDGSISAYLGGTLYIRKVEDENHAASGWTAFQLAARPAAPGLTKTDEALKGQKNGKVSGVTTAMEYSTDGGDTWNTCPGTEITGLGACTVLVRAKAAESAPCGEAASCMILEGKLITVAFDSKGGSSVQEQTGFGYGSKAVEPADPVREYYAFQGWYKDADCTTPWNFTGDTLTEENVTLYAKWKQIYFTVTVKVTNGKGQACNNAIVTLKRGSEVIDTCTKGTDGAYAFARHVEAGMYNVVVTYADSQAEQTKTALINISADQEVPVELPEPGVNSHLEVSAGADTPAVMVGGLDQEAAELKKTELGADTVTVSMEVEGKKESLVAAPVAKAIREEVMDGSSAGEPVIEYLDITVNKQVGSGGKTRVDETIGVMEIVVPFRFEGRSEITVVRCHNGTAEKLTPTGADPGADGTYREDRANGCIHIFTKKFSTYAVGYTASYTVSFDAVGGTVAPAAAQTESSGRLSALPEPTRDGYIFQGWYTSAEGGAAVTTGTVFTGSTTLYAHWEKKPASGGGSGGGGGWVSYYSVKVSDSEHGKVAADRTSIYAGGTVTLTVKPDEGYKLDKIAVADSQGKAVELTGKNGRYTFKMPGRNVTVKAEFVPVQTPSPSPEPTDSPSPSPKPWKNPFPDVSDTGWYIQAVEFVSENGLMSGYENGRFGPDNSLTRAQFAQIIYNKAGRPQAGSGVFRDVTTGWYADAVNWAAAEGVVTGIGGGRFAPDRPITRQDLAVMLWRYAGSPEPRKKELDFKDAGRVSGYAWKALCWANENGIVSGKGNGILDPKGKAARAEAAQMLMSYLKK